MIIDCVLLFNIYGGMKVFFSVPNNKISELLDSASRQSSCGILSKINYSDSFHHFLFMLAHLSSIESLISIKRVNWMCTWKMEWYTQHGNKCALLSYQLLIIIIIVMIVHFIYCSIKITFFFGIAKTLTFTFIVVMKNMMSGLKNSKWTSIL